MNHHARRTVTTRAALARFAVSLAALALLAAPLPAQRLTRPAEPWRTLATRHFDVHYPAAMEPWVRDVASRLDAVHEGVSALVGWSPTRRITVMVEDPTSQANGFALPFRDQPTIFLWPTPPDPTRQIAGHRGWGELLAVHEYAHLAHLDRPSRNPRQRLLWRLLPVDLGPIARRAPTWVIEGYATVVEGRLTGMGRPGSATRAAVLRRWALEGQLPSYAQLSGSRAFEGGAMPYLVGSAFLEWLEARAGDSSLVHLWRRMTARADRDFDAAFTGVFGASAPELYGRFVAELTGQALEVERLLGAQGLAEGELVQRRTWSTGEPAISPDGEYVAVTLRERERPARLVVWRADTAPERPEARERRERGFARDPEDVPPVPGRPRPREELATLHAVNGASYDAPRFFADGERVLAVRWVPAGDGTLRPDLFEWRWRDGAVRRLTHGAAIRAADPSPDGRRAAGVRCLNGICDLVLVDLERGDVTVLAPGAPDVVWYRPRWSPDGRAVLASVQRAGRWRLAVVDAAGGAPREIGPDDAPPRYGADWTPDGRAAIATSERGGIPHLARIDLADGSEQALTRTTGAHHSVDVGADGQTWFLALHARGHEVRRTHADSVLPPPPPTVVAGRDSLAPALPPPPVVADTFARTPLPAARPYGLGPRRWRWLPGGTASPEGIAATLMVANVDPVTRLDVVLQGTVGERGAWRGGVLAAAWRGTRVPLLGEVFLAEQRPTRLRDGALVPAALDARYGGAHLWTELEREGARSRLRGALGASGGTLRDAGLADARGERLLAWGEGGAAYTFARSRWHVGGALAAHGTAGRTDAADWQRAAATATLGGGWHGWSLEARGTMGWTNDAAPAYEQFAVGGATPPLFDARLLDQRLAMPALPPGTLAGRRAATLRVATRLGELTPYWWVGAAGEELERWHRVVGVEWEARFPAIGWVRLPAVHVRAGGGWSLGEPYRDRPRAYATIVYRP